MSKQDILTVTIISACVIAIILLVIRLTKAAKEDSTQPVVTQQEESQPEAVQTETDTSLIEENEMPAEAAEKVTDETPEVTSSEETEAATTTSQPAFTPTTEGRYMVLAGSFTQRANADRLVKKLRSKGYENARVELFDRGKYAVILVDRFDNLDEARELQQRLKADGVDSYVKLKSGANQ